MDERTIIDGAHNPAAVRVLAQTWREVFGDQKATLILAVLSDKNLRASAKHSRQLQTQFSCPAFPASAPLRPKSLQKFCPLLFLTSPTPSLQLLAKR